MPIHSWENVGWKIAILACMNQSPPSDIRLAVAVEAILAGLGALRVILRNPRAREPVIKPDGSPVTAGDLAVKWQSVPCSLNGLLSGWLLVKKAKQASWAMRAQKFSPVRLRQFESRWDQMRRVIQASSLQITRSLKARHGGRLILLMEQRISQRASLRTLFGAHRKRTSDSRRLELSDACDGEKFARHRI